LCNGGPNLRVTGDATHFRCAYGDCRVGHEWLDVCVGLVDACLHGGRFGSVHRDYRWQFFLCLSFVHLYVQEGGTAMPSGYFGSIDNTGFETNEVRRVVAPKGGRSHGALLHPYI